MKTRDCVDTPLWLVRTILRERPPPTRSVVEPCAGNGNFVQGLVEAGYNVTAVEIREEAKDNLVKAKPYRLYIMDWFDFAAQLRKTRTDTSKLSVLTNIPFSLAKRFTVSLLNLGFKSVRIVLPLSFLGTFDRQVVWRRWSLTGLHPIVPRPSFYKSTKGSTSYPTEYALFEWDRGKPALPMQFIVKGALIRKTRSRVQS